MDLFIVKKLISLFVGTAFSLVLCIALLALISCKFPQVARVGILVACGIFIALLSPWTSNLFVDSLESKYHRVVRPDSSVKYIAVLSGARGQRIIEAIRLWKLSPETRFITTTIRSSSFRKNGNSFTSIVAGNLGIPDSKLISVTGVRDTQEEIAKISEIVGNERVIIVSSAIHLPRVGLLANSKKLNAVLAPSDWLHSNSPWWKFNTGALYTVDRVLHEYVGIAWFMFKGLRAKSINKNPGAIPSASTADISSTFEN